MISLIIDIDGVVLRDETPIAGAKEFVSWLLRDGRRFVFLTNYSSQTPADLRERFLDVELDIPAPHFYTSAMATAEFLYDQDGTNRRVYVVGEGALVHSLYEAGFTLSESDADVVVLGETRAYNFEMIQKAAHLIRRGARFIATNPDVTGPQGRPSCGALAAPIERVTGKQPFYVGKPNPYMIRAALRHLESSSSQTWMVGDTMDTDIIAGIQAGMKTVLVLTGNSKQADLERYAYRPHFVLPNVSELPSLIERLEQSNR
ncbi:MAG: HAD family hydrolase [Vicinamibacteria bacterium]|nr:HAD family hydrolase [Vicinamibacteria bacterium]